MFAGQGAPHRMIPPASRHPCAAALNIFAVGSLDTAGTVAKRCRFSRRVMFVCLAGWYEVGKIRDESIQIHAIIDNINSSRV